MWRQASLPDSEGGFRPPAGVWAFSAEFIGGNQPAGLAEGSRWSLRARGERPPESCVRERSTQEGCQSCAFVRSIRLRSRSGTPAGVLGFFLRRCPEAAAPKNPRRPPATLWQPFWLAKPECPNSGRRGWCGELRCGKTARRDLCGAPGNRRPYLDNAEVRVEATPRPPSGHLQAIW